MMKKKVLLIDDDTELCEITKLLLHHTMKYQVFTAQNGPAGIQLARKHQPDVILLDVKMPVMDGGRVAEKLKEDDATRSIPIIFLTGLVKRDEVAEGGGFIAGHPFIAKPFNQAQLTEMIDRIIP
ncbi:MAG: response regulator [Syntrophorhabdaceae bacterium]